MILITNKKIKSIIVAIYFMQYYLVYDIHSPINIEKKKLRLKKNNYLMRLINMFQ